MNDKYSNTEAHLMKILAMADLHGNLPDVCEYLNKADVVIIAGDIAPDYSFIPRTNIDYQKKWLNTEFYKWVKALNKPIYACYGNHDYGTLSVDDPEIQIHVSAVVDNYFLFSWTREFCGWNYMVKDMESDPAENNVEGSIESRIKQAFKKRKAIPDIWVCHGPPFGVCEFEDRFSGSMALYKAIEKYQPKVVFVGHIHNESRNGVIGNSRIYNCSIVDNALDIVNDPIIVEVDCNNNCLV